MLPEGGVAVLPQPSPADDRFCIGEKRPDGCVELIVENFNALFAGKVFTRMLFTTPKLTIASRFQICRRMPS
jgi:hypothetical protein